jgi:hypothetical protein
LVAADRLSIFFGQAGNRITIVHGAVGHGHELVLRLRITVECILSFIIDEQIGFLQNASLKFSGYQYFLHPIFL